MISAFYQFSAIGVFHVNFSLSLVAFSQKQSRCFLTGKTFLWLQLKTTPAQVQQEGVTCQRFELRDKGGPVLVQCFILEFAVAAIFQSVSLGFLHYFVGYFANRQTQVETAFPTFQAGGRRTEVLEVGHDLSASGGTSQVQTSRRQERVSEGSASLTDLS